MSLGVFCLECDNTAMSNCLHLLWDGGLFLWQKSTQFFSVDTVYLSISSAVCSIGDLMRANRREVWRNTGALHEFVVSCRVLANNASRHSSLSSLIHLDCYAGSGFLSTLAVG